MRAGRASLPRAFPVQRLIATLLPVSLTRHLLAESLFPSPLPYSSPFLPLFFRRRRFPLVFPFTERREEANRNGRFGHGCKIDPRDPPRRLDQKKGTE